MNAITRRAASAGLLTVVFASTTGIAVAASHDSNFPVTQTRHKTHSTVKPASVARTGTPTTAATSHSSTLPFTGANNIVPDTIVGLALVGIGAGAVVAGRRRRTSE